MAKRRQFSLLRRRLRWSTSLSTGFLRLCFVRKCGGHLSLNVTVYVRFSALPATPFCDVSIDTHQEGKYCGSPLPCFPVSPQVATLAVKSTPQAISWLLCVTAIRYKWLAVGIFASVGSKVALTPVVLPGVIYLDVDCQGPWLMTALSCNCSGSILFECNENGWSILLLVLWVGSVSWSFDVGASVVAAAVADLVSSRWSSTSTDNNVNTTAWQSCRRVLHSSLG